MLASDFISIYTGLDAGSSKGSFINQALYGFIKLGGGWEVGCAMLQVFEPSEKEKEELLEKLDDLMLDYDYVNGPDVFKLFMDSFGNDAVYTIEQFINTVIVFNDIDMELNRETISEIGRRATKGFSK